MKDKIEIIRLGLDEKFLKELQTDVEVSAKMKDAIRGQITKLKRQPINKRQLRQKRWEGKWDILFKILKEAYDDGTKYVTKTKMINAIDSNDNEWPSAIKKFRDYLRTTKEDKWVVEKKVKRKVTYYFLVPFA